MTNRAKNYTKGCWYDFYIQSEAGYEIKHFDLKIEDFVFSVV